jgi:hypothetical protein
MSEEPHKPGFEQQWQQAFEGAELTPTKATWENVEQALTRQRRHKTFVVYSRLAAAACLLLAFGWLGNKTWQNRIETAGKLAGKEQTVSLPKENKSQAVLPNQKPDAVPAEENVSPLKKESAQNFQAFVYPKKNQARFSQATAQNLQKNTPNLTGGTVRDRATGEANNRRAENQNAGQLSDFVALSALPLRKTALKLSERQWLLKLNLMPAIALADLKEPEMQKEKVPFQRWTLESSVSASGFQPRFQVSQPEPVAIASANKIDVSFAAVSGNGNSPAKTASDLEQSTPLLSCRVSVMAGFMPTRRLRISSGVQWLVQHSQISTNQYVFNYANNQTEPLFAGLITGQPPVNPTNSVDDTQIPLVNNKPVEPSNKPDLTYRNSYQYLSVPVLVQYKIWQRGVDVYAGGGISADIFLKNTLRSSQEGTQSYTFGTEQSGVYKNLNFSGLFSLRAEYALGRHWGCFIESGFRQALSSATASPSLQSFPRSWTLGAGIQIRF